MLYNLCCVLLVFASVHDTRQYHKPEEHNMFTEVDLKETGCDGADWIHLAQDNIH
jgi:hypothetical protein